MIKEAYISFETAKLLKEKGFNEPTLYYYIRGHLFKGYDYQPNSERPAISAPTQSHVMRYFREVHNLHIEVGVSNDYSDDADGNEVETWYFWSFSIYGLPTGNVIYDDLQQFDCTEYESYEDAVEAGIVYVLNNLI